MLSNILKHKKEILKAIVVLLPLVGLGGLTYEQNKELQELRTTIVIEQDPIEVHVDQNQHTHPKHTHPELEKIIQEWH